MLQASNIKCGSLMLWLENIATAFVHPQTYAVIILYKEHRISDLKVHGPLTYWLIWV